MTTRVLIYAIIYSMLFILPYFFVGIWYSILFNALLIFASILKSELFGYKFLLDNPKKVIDLDSGEEFYITHYFTEGMARIYLYKNSTFHYIYLENYSVRCSKNNTKTLKENINRCVKSYLKGREEDLDNWDGLIGSEQQKAIWIKENNRKNRLEEIK